MRKEQHCADSAIRDIDLPRSSDKDSSCQNTLFNLSLWAVKLTPPAKLEAKNKHPLSSSYHTKLFAYCDPNTLRIPLPLYAFLSLYKVAVYKKNTP